MENIIEQIKLASESTSQILTSGMLSVVDLINVRNIADKFLTKQLDKIKLY